MPIHEYVCQKCGNQFEKLVRDGASSGICCPNCASAEVKKQLSSFSSKGTRSSTACYSGG